MTKRNLTVDIVKFIAIIGVIVIHVSANVLIGATPGSSQWNFALLWSGVLRGSVPLFLMCSGVLMLNPQKKLTLKKLYFHNILRIVVAMLLWGMAYKVCHLAAGNCLTIPNLINAIKHLLLFDQEFHFYYIHFILIVYILLPLTRFVAEKADEKLIRYLLIVWFALGIIYPTVVVYYPFNLLAGMTRQWLINGVYASIGYGLLGYYLSEHPVSFKKSLLMFLGGFAFIFFLTFHMSVKTGTLYEAFLSGTSVGVCVMAVGIFSLARFIRPGKWLQKLISYISKASFCIYLIHMFVLYILEGCFSVNGFIMSPALSIPLISLFTLAVCVGVYGIISKIPVINKWII